MCACLYAAFGVYTTFYSGINGDFGTARAAFEDVYQVAMCLEFYLI